MSNICAGIGRGQMLVLDEHIARRREINQLYRELLKDAPGISFLTNPSSDFESNYWLTCILIDPAKAGFTREDLRLKMESENIETRPLWKPMHLQPVFADCPFYGNLDGTHNEQGIFEHNHQSTHHGQGISAHLFDIGLCLPSSPVLSKEDIQRVVDLIKCVI